MGLFSRAGKTVGKKLAAEAVEHALPRSLIKIAAVGEEAERLLPHLTSKLDDLLRDYPALAGNELRHVSILSGDKGAKHQIWNKYRDLTSNQGLYDPGARHLVLNIDRIESGRELLEMASKSSDPSLVKRAFSDVSKDFSSIEKYAENVLTHEFGHAMHSGYRHAMGKPNALPEAFKYVDFKNLDNVLDSTYANVNKSEGIAEGFLYRRLHGVPSGNRVTPQTDAFHRGMNELENTVRQLPSGPRDIDSMFQRNYGKVSNMPGRALDKTGTVKTFQHDDAPFYHGTQRGWAGDVIPQAQNAGGVTGFGNMYGPGLYVSDTAKLSESYALGMEGHIPGMVRDPVVYGIHPKKPLNLMHEADEIDERVAKAFHTSGKEGLEIKPGMTFENAYNEFRTKVAVGQDVSNEVKLQMQQNLNNNLRDLGYDGIEHAGGYAGGLQHKSTVLFNPAESVGVTSAAREQVSSVVSAERKIAGGAIKTEGAASATRKEFADIVQTSATRHSTARHGLPIRGSAPGNSANSAATRAAGLKGRYVDPGGIVG